MMAVIVALETGGRETGWAIFVGGKLHRTGAIPCAKRQQCGAAERVDAIVRALDRIADEWQVEEVAYAEPFHNQWLTPEQDEMGEALRQWAQERHLRVYVYQAREVRSGVAGRGNAPKEDVAYAVMKRWGLVGVAKSTAEWEAVAAGDYHLQCRGYSPSLG